VSTLPSFEHYPDELESPLDREVDAVVRIQYSVLQSIEALKEHQYGIQTIDVLNDHHPEYTSLLTPLICLSRLFPSRRSTT
jgi:hypothetical protein